MLFDLRARGRRRAIKVIYASLALLMGGGLVLFGIGGDVQGGLFDAFREDSQRVGDDVIEKQIDAAEKKAAARPRNAVLWADLARLHYQQAGQGENYDQAQGTFTEKGRNELQEAATAWTKHIDLAEKPDANVANLMVQAFGPAGLNQLDKSVTAMEIVVESREATPQLYAQLAILAYQAGQTRKGDLARTRAIELAPKDDRETFRSQLDAAKQQAAGTAIQQATETQPSG